MPALVLLLAGCDPVSISRDSSSATSDHVPTAALVIHGRHLDEQLEVRGAAWRIAMRRADGGGADDGPPAGAVTGRLLDGNGEIIVERHTAPAGSARGGARDIAEPGAFWLFLTTDRPAEVAAIQVEAGAQLHEEYIGDPVTIALGDVPGSLAHPVDVVVTTDAAPEGVVAELHGTHVSGRTLDVHDGMLHLDPTRYGSGPAHLVVLSTRGLAADIDHAATHIAVDFQEHLEITVDGPVPVEILAGENLILSVQIYRHVAPGESRTEHPGRWTISFTSDVDGPLDALNASDGYPELYVASAALTSGDHLITVRATGDGVSTEREIPIRIVRGRN